MDPKLHPAITVSNIKTFIPITLEMETSQYASWAELFKIHCRAYQVLHHLSHSKEPAYSSAASKEAEKDKTPTFDEDKTLTFEDVWARLDAKVPNGSMAPFLITFFALSSITDIIKQLSWRSWQGPRSHPWSEQKLFLSIFDTPSNPIPTFESSDLPFILSSFPMDFNPCCPKLLFKIMGHPSAPPSRPSNNRQQPGLLESKPQQAYAASDSGSTYTLTELDQAFNTLSFHPPDQTWYMDTGHSTSKPGHPSFDVIAPVTSTRSPYNQDKLKPFLSLLSWPCLKILGIIVLDIPMPIFYVH
ncbi:hypothetical protein HanRHA438_Chr09g0383261 [Helianthus annuus]|nr:hypothetical protein HanRHA438_Chr09g0383261 [Helianthus annuus]